MIAPRRCKQALTRWHLIGGLLLAGLAAIVAGAAWRDLLKIAWLDREASHVLLVPVVVFWLVWVRRGRLRSCCPNGRMLGTFIIGIGWLLWSIGYRRQIQVFWHGGAVLMAAGGFVTVVGSDVLQEFMPAILSLVFLIPVPATGRQYISLPLQHVTAQVTQRLADVVGMDVERQGNLLNINNHDVAIVEACNGMRMIFTLLLASYVFAFVTALRGYVRLLVLVASPVTAVICNVLRLIPIVWMYGHVSGRVADTFHDISSWCMLILAFLGLLAIVRLLRWAMVPVTPFTLARG